MKQTRQQVRAIKQSIYLDVYDQVHLQSPYLERPKYGRVWLEDAVDTVGHVEPVSPVVIRHLAIMSSIFWIITDSRA